MMKIPPQKKRVKTKLWPVDIGLLVIYDDCTSNPTNQLTTLSVILPVIHSFTHPHIQSFLHLFRNIRYDRGLKNNGIARLPKRTMPQIPWNIEIR